VVSDNGDDTPWLASLPAGATYRLPRADDAREAHLTEANDVSRAFSEQQLARLFPTLTPGEPAPGGLWQVDRRRLERLFSMQLLDQLLDHGVDPSRVMLTNWQYLGDATGDASVASERVHSAIVGRGVGDGGRVMVSGVERATPGLRRLAEHVGRAWQARVTTSITVGAGAFSSQSGVVVTYDHLIIPVKGLRRVVATMPDGSSLHSGPLGPGDALYLPAGATVSTVAVNEMFVHLEIRIERPSPLVLLPLVGGVPVAQQIAWADDSSSLHDSLLARWCAGLPSRPGTRFSSVSALPDVDKLTAGWVRPTFTGGWCTVATDESEEATDEGSPATLAAAAGICLSLPESSLALVASTLSGPPRRVSEVVAASPMAGRLVHIMISSGLLEFFPTESGDDSWDAVDDGPGGGVAL
jgi:hypothetical protein